MNAARSEVGAMSRRRKGVGHEVQVQVVVGGGGRRKIPKRIQLCCQHLQKYESTTATGGVIMAMILNRRGIEYM